MTSNKGFTLVELLMVIVILGVVGVGLSGAFVTVMDIFTASVKREQLLAEGNYAITRLEKELSQAVPNSVRISGNATIHCLEFVPILWPVSYVSAPISPTSDRNLDLIFPFDADGNIFTIAANQQLIVYPLNADDVYDTTNDKRVNINACSDDGDGDCSTQDDTDNVIQLTLDNSVAENSPEYRGYIAEQTVSYCVSNNLLYRKEESISSTQSTSISSASIVSRYVSNALSNSPNNYSASDPFNIYTNAAGSQNYIQIKFLLEDEDESITLTQEVQLAANP